MRSKRYIRVNITRVIVVEELMQLGKMHRAEGKAD